MTLLDCAQLARRNLRASPVRSFLTVLGLGVGIGAILTVVTLGSAGQARVENEISRMGVNKIWITAKPESAQPLRQTERETVSRATGETASAQAAALIPMPMAGETLQVQVVGCDEAYQSVEGTALMEGRFFYPAELAQGSYCALVDVAVAEAMERLLDGALDKQLNIAGCLFTAVGVTAAQPAQAAAGLAGSVYIPLTAFQRLFSDRVACITVMVTDTTRLDEATARAESALPAGGSFQLTSLSSEIKAARSIVDVFVLVLMSVAVVCVIVGGIGIMNIMLLSVRERRREIGVMKALGASDSQLLALFLAEAVVYAAAGGLFGVICGAALIRICAAFVGVEAWLAGGLILPAVAGGGILGVLFGVVPAMKAACMLPAEALREG